MTPGLCKKVLFKFQVFGYCPLFSLHFLFNFVVFTLSVIAVPFTCVDIYFTAKKIFCANKHSRCTLKLCVLLCFGGGEFHTYLLGEIVSFWASGLSFLICLFILSITKREFEYSKNNFEFACFTFQFYHIYSESL